MKTIMKSAALAGAFVFAAGSAAWAQSYTTNPGSQGSYSSNPGTYSNNPGTSGSYSSNSGTYSNNPGTSGSYSGNAGTQGYSNPSTYGANQQGWNSNQQGWNSGMQGQGTSTAYGSQPYSQAGYGMGNITTYQEAERELGRYGYGNIHDLRAMQGWSADAMRNGQRVHVIIGDNGLIATFPGR
jgi:hypothetical protein